MACPWPANSPGARLDLGADQRLKPRRCVSKPLIHVTLEVADPHVNVPVLREYADIHDDERHNRAEHRQV